MLLGAAVGRHAALAAEPLAEGDAREVAGEVVAPIVIDADDVARLAALVEHEERAAVGTAVLEGVQRSALISRHHHRHGAEARAAIAARFRQLGFEAEEIPGRPAKDARLLLLVDVAVGVEPIRHPREPFGRPVSRCGCARHGASLDLRLHNAATVSVRSLSPTWGGLG